MRRPVVLPVLFALVPAAALASPAPAPAASAEPAAPAEPGATGAAAPAPAAGEPAPAAASPRVAAAPEALSARDSLARVDATAPAAGPGLEAGGVRFELHGYARMPLAAQTTPREPFLVDNDYYLSGFAYTRLFEPDWSELFLSATRGDYKAEFGLFASLYSDYAAPELDKQLGIAQASVTAQRFLDHEPLTVQLGVFWDRYGHLEPYDTYVFGRTHQGGVKVAYDLPRGARVQGGVGLHQAQLRQNQGLTPIAHLAGTYPVGPVDVGGYLLRTWTRDVRQLSPIQDGTMWVAGLDARVRLPDERGTAYVALGFYDMSKVLYLAPALEVMHSTGGRGLTENFLGLESSDDGTGRMYTLAADAPVRVTRDLGVRAFGMATWVRSNQVDEMDPAINRDRRMYLKWGVEPSYRVHKGVRVAARFDRVILDLYDADNSFRVLSPRLVFPLEGWGELAFQYSRYWYGDKIRLRPGQVPLVTDPDTDAFKLQAQVAW